MNSCNCRRRDILKAGLALGLGAPLLAQDASKPKEGDFLVKTTDTTTTPLTPADIKAGSRQMMAWAMDPTDKTVRKGSRLNRILLIHLDALKFTPETKSRAADGVVAYSAICTHAGCEVTEWVPEKQLLFCPCHESTFDPADAARVIDGPAVKILPALPLGLADGKLIVLKPFTAPVVFETQ
jgi:rieske iron-sulfur protein